MPLLKDLQDRIGQQCASRMMRTVSGCLKIDGVAAGAEVVFGVILGTGPAVLVVREQLLQGVNVSPANGGTIPCHSPKRLTCCNRRYCGRSAASKLI